MKHYKDQVLVIKGRVTYADPKATIFEVPKMPVKTDGPLDMVLVECWPIHTIRQMTRSPNKQVIFANDKPGPHDGVRLTIDPELDPILALYYRSPQEGELSRLRKLLRAANNEADLATETAKVYKDPRDAAYNTIDKQNARIEAFNLMSLWGKLVFILKGKVV